MEALDPCESSIFADNSLLFCRVDRGDVSSVKEILGVYESHRGSELIFKNPRSRMAPMYTKLDERRLNRFQQDPQNLQLRTFLEHLV